MRCVDNTSDERREKLLRVIKRGKFRLFSKEHLSAEILTNCNNEHVMHLKRNGVVYATIKEHMENELTTQENIYCQEFHDDYLAPLFDLVRKGIITRQHINLHLEGMVKTINKKRALMKMFLNSVIRNVNNKRSQWLPKFNVKKFSSFELDPTSIITEFLTECDKLPESMKKQIKEPKKDAIIEIIYPVVEID